MIKTKKQLSWSRCHSFEILLSLLKNKKPRDKTKAKEMPYIKVVNKGTSTLQSTHIKAFPSSHVNSSKIEKGTSFTHFKQKKHPYQWV